MLSFTSNSNDRIPSASWGRIWVISSSIVLLTIVGWNGYWYSQGVYPAPKNNPQLWAFHRDRVKPNDEKAIVLLGSSRILAGVDQKVFEKKVGTAPVQLGINDKSSYFFLEHFANDETFKGTIIAEHSAFGFSRREEKDRLGLWLTFKDKKYQFDSFNLHIRRFRSYVLATPSLGDNIPEMIQNVFAEDGLKRYPNMESDRSTKFYRSSISDRRNLKALKRNIEIIEQLKKENPDYRSVFLQRSAKAEELIKRIQARGGRVIFVKFPISGQLKQTNDEAFPRDKFWDVFAAKTIARTINFEDYSTLSKFMCIDGSHLAAEDTAEFTKNLVEILFNPKRF